MKQIFILNRTKFQKDGTIKSVETSLHDTLSSALAKHYRNIGADMEDEKLSGSVSVITDTLGNRHEGYSWGEIIEPTVTE